MPIIITVFNMTKLRQINNKQPSELEVFIHDIASPLTNIGISLENMKSQIYTNPHQLERSIMATIDSLEYLFLITRHNNPNGRQKQQSFYLFSDLISEIVSNKFKFLLETNKIILIKETIAFVTINKDRRLLNRVISNIISNSIDALSGKNSKVKRIKIKSEVSNNFLFITIVDNGIGMSPTTLRSVFNYHYSTKENHTGIGLSTVKEIIEETFCGNIVINSLISIGTVVKITIPI